MDRIPGGFPGWLLDLCLSQRWTVGFVFCGHCQNARSASLLESAQQQAACPLQLQDRCTLLARAISSVHRATSVCSALGHPFQPNLHGALVRDARVVYFPCLHPISSRLSPTRVGLLQGEEGHGERRCHLVMNEVEGARTRTHTRNHMHAIHARAHAHTRTHTHTHTHAHTHTYTHTHTHTHIRLHAHTHTHTHAHITRAHLHTPPRTCKCASRPPRRPSRPPRPCPPGLRP